MKNSTAIINVACAILFLGFVFCYVFFFQADVLIYGQYVWSGGMRHLNPIVWASLITLILWIIQLGIQATVKLPSRFQSITYFPSLLMLGALTSLEPDASGHMSVGNWWWLSVLLLVVFGFVVRFLMQCTSLEGKLDTSIFSQVAWNNFGILALLMLMTCGIGNTDELLHVRLKAERYVYSRQFNKVLAEGKNVEETDSSLTMFRIFALSETHKLGEELFTYPVVGGSKAMIPQPDGSVSTTFSNPQAIWRHLGAVPLKWDGDTKAFLKTMIRQGKAKPCVEDYLLTAYLLDKDLNGFAHEIKRYYDFRSAEELKAFEEKIEKKRKKLEKTLGDSIPEDSLGMKILTPLGTAVKAKSELPQHYREALVLYMNLCQRPCLRYSDEILDADYDDFVKLCHASYPTTAAHQYAIKDAYSGTYWLYYKSK